MVRREVCFEHGTVPGEDSCESDEQAVGVSLGPLAELVNWECGRDPTWSQKRHTGEEEQSEPIATSSSFRDFSLIPTVPIHRKDRPESPISGGPYLPAAVLQAKLVVTDGNEELKHQTDRVADQVLRMLGPELPITSEPNQLSRKCTACENEKEKWVQRKPATPRAKIDAPPIVNEVLRSSGMLEVGFSSPASQL